MSCSTEGVLPIDEFSPNIENSTAKILTSQEISFVMERTYSQMSSKMSLPESIESASRVLQSSGYDSEVIHEIVLQASSMDNPFIVFQDVLKNKVEQGLISNNQYLILKGFYNSLEDGSIDPAIVLSDFEQSIRESNLNSDEKLQLMKVHEAMAITSTAIMDNVGVVSQEKGWACALALVSYGISIAGLAAITATTGGLGLFVAAAGYSVATAGLASCFVEE